MVVAALSACARWFGAAAGLGCPPRARSRLRAHTLPLSPLNPPIHTTLLSLPPVLRLHSQGVPDPRRGDEEDCAQGGQAVRGHGRRGARLHPHRGERGGGGGFLGGGGGGVEPRALGMHPPRAPPPRATHPPTPHPAPSPTLTPHRSSPSSSATFGCGAWRWTAATTARWWRRLWRWPTRRVCLVGDCGW